MNKIQKCIPFIELWRKLYCIIIPIITTCVYAYIFLHYDFCIWLSENFGDTLTSIITFVSIIISFFGVLLTILISAREKSQLINYFLDTADKDAFVMAINKLIICGLMTVIVSAVLFGYDIFSKNINFTLSCMGIYFLMRFTTLTYRFTNLLLRLFIKEKKDISKKEGKKISNQKLEELNRKLEENLQ